MMSVSEEKDNPFSFASFLKPSQENDSDDVSGFARRESVRKKKEKTLVILDDDEVEVQTEKSDENNPFSFKNFVQEKEIDSSSDSENAFDTTKPVDLEKCDLPLILDETANIRDSVEILHSDIENENIKDFKHKLKEKDERIEYLEKELERIKKKEAEDTASLENMVQRVEETLQITTKRALSAEAQVNQLKQEIKTLQGEVKTLNNELSHTQQETTSEAHDLAQKLKTAAIQAESNLKDLLKGVTELKEYSTLVANIGSVKEEQ